MQSKNHPLWFSGFEDTQWLNFYWRWWFSWPILCFFHLWYIFLFLHKITQFTYWQLSQLWHSTWQARQQSPPYTFLLSYGRSAQHVTDFYISKRTSECDLYLYTCTWITGDLYVYVTLIWFVSTVYSMIVTFDGCMWWLHLMGAFDLAE